MTSSIQRKLFTLSLPFGYYIYRKVLADTKLSSNNIFLQESKLDEIKTKNIAIENGRAVIGHHSNDSISSKKKRIVIIGGGLMGVTSSYMLSKNPNNEVILIDKYDDVAQETSYCNGAIFCPSLTSPWINDKLFYNLWESLFVKDSLIKLYFSVLKEKYLFTWFFNAILNSSSKSTSENTEKLSKLGQSSITELQILSKAVDLKLLMNSAHGTLQLCKDLESLKQIPGTSITNEGKMKVLNQQELYTLESGISDGKIKYNGAILFPLDSNLDSYETTRAIANQAKINGAKLYLNTEFITFLFQDKQRQDVKGIITDQGVILCDEVVIAGGNHTKNILDKLGVRLPMIPIKGYTITADLPKNREPLSHNVCDDINKVYVTMLGNKYRISGLCEFRGIDHHVDEDRTKLLLSAAMNKVGHLDEQKITVWTGCRPVSSDDVPIIGKVSGYNNIYINSGQGSKGLTLSLGSARLLTDIIEENDSALDQRNYSLNRFYLI